MLLVFARKILVSSETCKIYNFKASELLIKFVNDYGLLYNHNFVNYNVYSLIHLHHCRNHLLTSTHSVIKIIYNIFKKFLNEENILFKKFITKKKKKIQLLTSQSNVPSHSPIFINEIYYWSKLTFLSISDKLYEKMYFKLL